MQNEVKGWFRREIFYNQENDYLVGKVQVLNSSVDTKILKQYSKDNLVTIVGYIPKLLKNEIYHFYGDFKKSNYGPQFMVESYEIAKKNDSDSIIEFLSSELFKGIGKTIAKRIVNKLGNDAFEKILNDKSVLLNIKGMNPKLANNIYDVLVINIESEKIIRYLIKNGFGTKVAKDIFNKYKQNTLNYLNENPYILIDGIFGIGFKKADNFALSIDYDMNSTNRIQAAIKYVFEEYCFNEGFTFIYKEQILNQTKTFLNENKITLSNEEIINNLNILNTNKKIIIEDGKYYLPNLYNAENNIAKKIKSIIKNNNDKYDESLIYEYIDEIEKENNISYTNKQKEAIISSLNNNITILTGGPGTGKTTVVNGIILAYIKLNNYKKSNITNNIALVAPTGRAAKRLEETTNCNASTIHRLLGYQISGFPTFDEHNKLGCKLVVCDESSMVDTLLCANLLKALKNDVKIVFVGDENQLPSVGPGEVLKDLIFSSSINTIKLDKIYRQSKNSSIIKLAYDVNQQVISNDLLTKQNDRNFIACSNEMILENIQFIVSNAINKGFSIDTIQVLVPMYKGMVGINNINNYLQSALNPINENQKEFTHYNKIYRLGDKVIQLVNNPTDNVMNGDIGYIKHIYNNKKDDNIRLVIDFDGNEVKYTDTMIDNISLAYCISIHKSQGSEFDIVVLVLSKSYSIMLRKKLIYTAITRAKKYLILVGDVKAFEIAVNNTKEIKRQTTLQNRLMVLDNNKKKIEIDNFEFEYQLMENITPYDFLK